MTQREIYNLINRINGRLDSLVNKFGQDFVGYTDLAKTLNNYLVKNKVNLVTSDAGIIHVSRKAPTDEKAKLRWEANLKKLDYATKERSVGNLLEVARKDLEHSIGPVPKGRAYNYIQYQRAKDVAYVKYWLPKVLEILYIEEKKEEGSDKFKELIELLNRKGFGVYKDVTYEEYYNALEPIVNEYFKKT